MEPNETLKDCINDNIPGFKHIELEDKEVFNHYFSKYPLPMSEYTFSNLYMWRQSYDFIWNEYKDHLVLISLEKDNMIDLFPPAGEDPISIIKGLKNVCDKESLTLRIIRVPESFKEKLEKSDMSLKIEDDRKNWDYVYLVKDLVELSGSDYQKIRQKLNKYQKHYDWHYETIEKSNLDECMELHEEWCEEKNCEEIKNLKQEKIGVTQIFKNWDVLDLTGGLLRVDGKIMAFALYEDLLDDTLVCHVEKANTDYEGAYNAINQISLNNLGNGYKYVNREQDLGIRGLRIAKKRYHPDHYVKKYIAVFE